MSIPLRIAHIGKNMFELIKQVIDVIDKSWAQKIMGNCSDGARSVTAKTKGVPFRMQMLCVT